MSLLSVLMSNDDVCGLNVVSSNVFIENANNKIAIKQKKLLAKIAMTVSGAKRQGG